VSQYREQTHGPLRPGLVTLIGPDGVWEMPDAKGEWLGKDRLSEVIRESAAGSATEIAQAIRDRLAAFPRDTKQVDDVTFVIVKVRALADAEEGR
jgi:serine phosphatase RsbU (regulator of sigma subunit)